MATWGGVRNLLNIVKEVDIRPIREEAERGLGVAVLSRNLEAAITLAEFMRGDPERLGVETSLAPIAVTEPEKFGTPPGIDLAIFIIQPEELPKYQARPELMAWREAGTRMVILVDTSGLTPAAKNAIVPTTAGGKLMRILHGELGDADFLMKKFVPATVAIMPDLLLPLARNYPLFRGVVARRIVEDTSTSNAAYALSTGVAEIVPVLNIPLTVADMVVLTKAQAFMVYRLGLALGLSTRWQTYLAEFGGVLGSGFLWRQAARLLVGLVPVIGIVPKVGVAYAGTYVVGNAVHQWYLNNRHLPAGTIKRLYTQAAESGKELGRNIFRRRLGLPSKKVKKPARLTGRSGEITLPDEGQTGVETTKETQAVACPHCGQVNQAEARYCMNCGKSLQRKQKKAA